MRVHLNSTCAPFDLHQHRRNNDRTMFGFTSASTDQRHKLIVGLGIFLAFVASLAVATLILSLVLSWNRVVTAGNADKSIESRLDAIEKQLKQTESVIEDIKLLV